MNTKYNIGDLIQLESIKGLGVIVDIKWNGSDIYIQWVSHPHLPPQQYRFDYLNSWAKVLNCGPIQNP